MSQYFRKVIRWTQCRPYVPRPTINRRTGRPHIHARQRARITHQLKLAQERRI